ncbi:hypothetical protein Taro_054810 [Colocasia esculenta]|uniref:Uncharacterized protein n=1 Tax=Colocasia esculenta TaxID=4460 RepID=A0A843XPN7_COLES|nr:hypothetical protein [Colocasia esculenta]
MAGRRTRANAHSPTCDEEVRVPTPQETPIPPPPTIAQVQEITPKEQGYTGASMMERFKRMAPPPFKGESQPLVVENWLKEIEKIFFAIRCVEEDKTCLATYMLQTHYLLRRTGVVGDDTLAVEAVETDSERGD